MTDTATAPARRRGRLIGLMAPVMFDNRPVHELIIAPVRIDHTLRWLQGEINGIHALLSELSGLPQEVIRQIEYPDYDVVMAAFLASLPPEIRNNLERPLVAQAPAAPIPS